MSKILAISEANAIAFHGMAVIAGSKTAINATNLAKRIGASRHHVSKVFQKLVKAGFLSSTRGPSGGFMLRKKPEEITLFEIYETIEGNITINPCPIDKIKCPFSKCMLGGICYELAEKFLIYMKENNLKKVINNIM